jgi:hypothetical protein
MDKVVHFEVPADDIERAKKFYSSVFGWQMQDMPEMEYVIAHTVEVDEKMMPKESGAINGGIMKRSKAIKSPVIAMSVSSIDAYIQKIKNAGGKIVKPKVAIGSMGYYAYESDSEGNAIGLWENAKK